MNVGQTDGELSLANEAQRAVHGVQNPVVVRSIALIVAAIKSRKGILR